MVTSLGQISLDHNHTHFLLVDDGTENIFGSQTLVDFQLQLESYISEKVEIGFAERNKNGAPSWSRGNLNRL